ncbi:hypothetical protein JAAARDRAFT_118000 [Jaapia argillacea MUCL 33604]|uniref:Putative lipoate-protein ligase A n=1 Tax=Jaapia argillacea MUCL 33604 TaxID=933084 RepID=A0A067QDH5_9AGAM|nr:hypothetical protein JAAARDRAFT_118000 [Jaapia argillacea MUCL 33604]
MFPHLLPSLPKTLRHSRRFLSTCSSPLSPHHSIYLSRSTNPYFNLSLEDWLFRHKSHKEPLLLLYRDDPCVVIGRNQNPWKEVNLGALKKAGVPCIRRRSGGGTVYHDLGNTNYSIHLPRSSFDRNVTSDLVLRAVRSMGIDARVNDRNDICVGPEKMSPFSTMNLPRSAYKIVNNRAYHHGTMLISTRLDTLGDLLHSTKETMETKGVASVRSPVCNLRQWSESVSHDAFVDAVVTQFRQEYGIDEEVHSVEENAETRNVEYIRHGMTELPSWDWAYGQTPEFTFTIHQLFECGQVTAQIRSKHGVILSCSLALTPLRGGDTSQELQEELGELGKQLEGQRYGFVDEARLRNEIGDHTKAVWEWLREQMDT